jgi:hypothetical protein
MNRVVGAGCMCDLSHLERPKFLFCRYTQLLTALAAALAEALPGAAASLRRNLAAVLATEPQAAPEAEGTATWRRSDTAKNEWGELVSHAEGQTLEKAPTSTADMEAANNAAFGTGSASDSDSKAGSEDSISAVAGASDTELEPFLDLNFCAQQMQLDATRSPSDSSPAATLPNLPSPFAPQSPPSQARGNLVEQAAVAPAGMPPGGPRDCERVSSSGSSSSDAGGDDGSQGGGGSGEDVAELKAALHGRPSIQPTAPAAGQLVRTVDGIADLRWHAASSYNVSSGPMPCHADGSWSLYAIPGKHCSSACLCAHHRSFRHPLQRSRPGFGAQARPRCIVQSAVLARSA